MKDIVVEPTRILLMRFTAAGDLALALRSVLEAGQSFNFDLREEIVPEDQLTSLTRIVAASSAQWQPNLAVLCIPQCRLEGAAAGFGFVRRYFQEVPIVIATENSEPKDLCQLLDLGAADFVTRPFRSVDVLPRFWRLCHQTNADDPVVAQLKEKLGLKQLVGESPVLLAEIRKIPPVARCDATVLIAGETGTGKEMFARAIHHLSPRSAKPFVPVNCGAMPVELVENELFGHESGAFTGAQSAAVGLLQKANGGSLFLDDVDCLPLLAQVKLLRFLQEKEFRPLGTNKLCRVDVRVIAASNTNLEEAVQKGRFREDLYFRLNVVVLVLPPLRDRKEDIPLLARHFIAKYVPSFGSATKDLSMSAIQKLMLYDWPGNVRELENVIERSMILHCKTVLHAEDIQLRPVVSIKEGECFQDVKAKMIAQFERAFILELLRDHHGNITRAATAAGKNRRAFWELMRKHDIRVQPQQRI